MLALKPVSLSLSRLLQIDSNMCGQRIPRPAADPLVCSRPSSCTDAGVLGTTVRDGYVSFGSGFHATLWGRVSFLLLLLVLVNDRILAQEPPVILWQHCYGGLYSDFGEELQPTRDRGYVIAGISESSDGDVKVNKGGYDYWILRIDSSGVLLNQASFGGSLDDLAHSVSSDSDGGYLVAGECDSYDGDVTDHHGTRSGDAWILKLDSGLSIVWKHSFGAANPTEWDLAQTIIADSAGESWFAGVTNGRDGDVSGNHGMGDAWVVHLTDSGQLKWQQCLGGTQNEYAFSGKRTIDGGSIILATTTSADGQITGYHGNFDMWAVKLDAWGSIEYSSALGGTEEERAADIRELADGGFIVTGSTKSHDGDVMSNHGGFDFWVVRLDKMLRIVWERTLGGSGDDFAHAVIQTADGGFVVVGTTFSNDGDVIGYHEGAADAEDVWVAKLDSDGVVMWTKALGGSRREEGMSVVETSDGGLVLLGSAASPDGDVQGLHGGAGADVWVVKLGFGPRILSARQMLLRADLCNNSAIDTLWVHNVGAAPLVITRASFASGPLEFSLAQPALFPDTVSSGDSARFIVAFVSSVQGTFSTTLEMFSNDSIHSPWSIAVDGRKDSIAFTVTGVANDTIDLGVVACGETRDTAVSIACETTVQTSIGITNRDTLLLSCSAQVVPFAVPGGTDRLSLRWNGTGNRGLSVARMVFRDSCGRTREVTVKAITAPANIVFSMPPDSTVCPGTQVVDLITFRSTTEASVQLTVVGSDTLFGMNPRFLNIAPGDSAVLSITFAGANREGRYQSAIDLVDACGGHHALTVGVNVHAPAIAIVPVVERFICPNTPGSVVVPIANRDSLAHTLSLASAGCTLSSPTLVLGANQSDSVTATVAGHSAGLDTSSIVITDECGGVRTVSIILTVGRVPIALSLGTDTGSTDFGVDRAVYVIADPADSLMAHGGSFTVMNESTALHFRRVDARCTAQVIAGADSVRITLQACAFGAIPHAGTADTVATLQYQTGAGITLLPTVRLSNGAPAQWCDTVLASGSVVLSLSAPCGWAPVM
jgi:hypothetical protein